MKATQAGTKKDALPEMPKRKCEICGKESHPYHYTRHGKGQVCSSKCSEDYANRRFVDAS